MQQWVSKGFQCSQKAASSPLPPEGPRVQLPEHCSPWGNFALHCTALYYYYALLHFSTALHCSTVIHFNTAAVHCTIALNYGLAFFLRKIEDLLLQCTDMYFTAPGGQFRLEQLELGCRSDHVQPEVSRPHGLAVEKVQVMLLHYFSCGILEPSRPPRPCPWRRSRAGRRLRRSGIRFVVMWWWGRWGWPK